MRILFWTSAFFITYVYIGYPALLLAWTRLFPRTGSAAVGGPGFRPTISIVVAARNEGARLPARVENLLALNYPAHRRQILIVSDGSTDQTIAALRRYLDRIEIVLQPRSGKAAALNAGVARATGEILIFADARQTFSPEAANALVAPFADPSVGAVSGELILGCEPFAGRRRAGDRRTRRAGPPQGIERRVSDRRSDRGSAIAEGVRYYWGYEKLLRRLESSIGSMLGATGAIYALRRSLWQPLPHDAILDDVLAPMRAVLTGARVVFEPRAQAYDQTAPDARSERRRKVRTLAGNFQLLFFEPRLLLPIVNPVWLQFVSHKIARLLVPYALLALLISSAALAPVHIFYACALIAQSVFYLESAHGAWLAHRRRHAPVPRYTLMQRAGTVAFAFVMMNASAVAGAGLALAGRKVWR